MRANQLGVWVLMIIAFLLFSFPHVASADGPYRVVVPGDEPAVSIGGKVVLRAKLYRGDRLEFTWPWTFKILIDEGSLSGNVYQPPAAAGRYRVRLLHPKVSRDASQGVTWVNVKGDPELARLELRPGSIVLPPGASTQLTVSARSAAGRRIPYRPAWSATGGRVTTAGLYTAPDAPGRYEVKVSGRAGIAARARVVVSSPPLGIVIRPTAARVAANGRMTFTVELSVGGKRVPSWPWEFEYLASAGSFDSNVFTAPAEAGSVRITIRHRSRKVSGKARVTVLAPKPVPTVVEKPKPVPARVVIHPRRIEVLPGGHVLLSARLQRGKKAVLTPPWEFGWSADHGKFAENRYTAPETPGRYTVRARHEGGQSGEAMVVVRELPKKRTAPPKKPPTPSISRIALVPVSVILRPGQSATFRATATDARGVEVPFTPRWHATGGTIGADGRYTAGKQAGSFEVTASDPTGPARTIARVSIRAGDDVVELLYAAMGTRWAAWLRQRNKTVHELTDFIIIKILYATTDQIRRFRDAFVVKYGKGGAGEFRKAWHTVLFEFGEYYGREIRRNTSPRREMARFVADYLLRLPTGDRDKFSSGFVSGYRGASARTVYDEIISLAKQMRGR